MLSAREGYVTYNLDLGAGNQLGFVSCRQEGRTEGARTEKTDVSRAVGGIIGV